MNKHAKKLLTTLESIESLGKFMVSGRAKPIIPGINVDKVGEIGIPVHPLITKELTSIKL